MANVKPIPDDYPQGSPYLRVLMPARRETSTPRCWGPQGGCVSAGAKSLRPVEKQFYGDRSDQFENPFGHRWSVASHVEDVSPEEMERRSAEEQV